MFKDNFKGLKMAINSLFDSTCNIYEYKECIDDKTKRTTYKEVLVLENQPCRISYKNISTTKESNVSELIQITKLFIDSEIKINPGSKIVVTKNGRSTDFKNSGEPALYSNHQEILLDLFKGWS